jgi:hypothetical protein
MSLSSPGKLGDSRPLGGTRGLLRREIRRNKDNPQVANKYRQQLSDMNIARGMRGDSLIGSSDSDAKEVVARRNMQMQQLGQGAGVATGSYAPATGDRLIERQKIDAGIQGLAQKGELTGERLSEARRSAAGAGVSNDQFNAYLSKENITATSPEVAANLGRLNMPPEQPDYKTPMAPAGNALRVSDGKKWVTPPGGSGMGGARTTPMVKNDFRTEPPEYGNRLVPLPTTTTDQPPEYGNRLVPLPSTEDGELVLLPRSSTDKPPELVPLPRSSTDKPPELVNLGATGSEEEVSPVRQKLNRNAAAIKEMGESMQQYRDSNVGRKPLETLDPEEYRRQIFAPRPEEDTGPPSLIGGIPAAQSIARSRQRVANRQALSRGEIPDLNAQDGETGYADDVAKALRGQFYQDFEEKYGREAMLDALLERREARNEARAEQWGLSVADYNKGLAEEARSISEPDFTDQAKALRKEKIISRNKQRIKEAQIKEYVDRSVQKLNAPVPIDSGYVPDSTSSRRRLKSVIESIDSEEARRRERRSKSFLL